MKEKIDSLVTGFCRGQARLINEQDELLSIVTEVLEKNEAKPDVIAYLRGSIVEFYRARFEHMATAVKILELLQ